MPPIPPRAGQFYQILLPPAIPPLLQGMPVPAPHHLNVHPHAFAHLHPHHTHPNPPAPYRPSSAAGHAGACTPPTFLSNHTCTPHPPKPSCPLPSLIRCRARRCLSPCCPMLWLSCATHSRQSAACWGAGACCRGEAACEELAHQWWPAVPCAPPCTYSAATSVHLAGCQDKHKRCLMASSIPPPLLPTI